MVASDLLGRETCGTPGPGRRLTDIGGTRSAAPTVEVCDLRRIGLYRPVNEESSETLFSLVCCALDGWECAAQAAGAMVTLTCFMIGWSLWVL
ncbi:hypothetical protein GCM10010298_47120 [Streptomyces microflavus]|uniref:Uncharacterized protein n=1 Tax=Streptomyces microflavus TaxID=1919 RepID=A0A7J0CIU6_STRMI|nr:hypothetical protein Smic_03900 [Streptomyces microflavus]GGX76607.1 hypothetical protein GCM10010298_47120 [Streptomyces microflavus]